MKAFTDVINFINKGHPRSVKLKKNITLSLVIKGIAVIIGLIKVPILIAYLDPEKYGVWLTISSIIIWVHYFDLGLGHGLRNKLAETIAKDEMEKGRGLVSTAYASISVLMMGIFILLIPVVFLSDWNKILNVYSITPQELQYSVLIVLLMFNLRFIFQLITVILKADQRPALSEIFLPMSSILSLLLVFIIRSYTVGSLFAACAIIAIPPVIVLLIANIYFFSRDYMKYRPSLKIVDKSYLKDIYSLGLKFFIVQLGALVMFNTSNIILTQIVNPEAVTVFNVTKKYFDLPVMFFMIILTPYWSAITDAYTRREYNWIKSNMSNLFKVSVAFGLGVLLMLLLSGYAFRIWLGDSVIIPYQLSLVFTIYSISVIFLSPYNYFLNGVGKLNLGIRILIFKVISFIPVAIYLTQLFGPVGLVFALILINSLPNLLFSTVQYKKIINREAYGIWNA